MSTKSHTASVKANTSNCPVDNKRCMLLGTAMVTICHRNNTYTVRALLDSGSEGTFISESLQKRLNLHSKGIRAQVSGLNEAISGRVQQVCTFSIGSPRNKSLRIKGDALVLPKLTGLLPSHSISDAILKTLPDIPLADNNFFKSQHIDLLIGGDLYPKVILNGIKKNILGSLMAQRTVFGWILTGPVTSGKNLNTTYSTYFNEVSLDQQLTKFWELEEVPKTKLLTVEEEQCERFYTDTTFRNEEGRYVVSLPFKLSPPGAHIGASRHIAMRQFLRSETSLSKKPLIKEEYSKVLQEYVDLGHMHEVRYDKFEDPSNNYYLPHHAVHKPESTTSKLRVVFNGSCPTSNGVSLNDILYTGPPLQTDLTILIVRWRLLRYVFNADIEKMYRQIVVNPKHTTYQRILFRDSLEGEIKDFQLDRVTFGLNCAPYLAIRTLLQLAKDTKLKYPLASEILNSSTYVDDVLAGAHDIPEAVKARDQLIEALNSAGFPLRKWTSNSKQILLGLQRNHLLATDFLEIHNTSEAKTLGIRWNAKTDQFYFLAKSLDNKDSFTKREVLSTIAKLFDPAGWLSPITMVAKILMQQIWLEKTKWDEQLNQKTLHQWKTFLDNYPHINSIRIPRWVSYRPNCHIQFHGFCDASEKAYGAAIYIRVQDASLNVQTHLLLAKTKVAPVKTISIPRLELCGAVLLSNMVDFLLPQMGIEYQGLYFWTDSTIVLAWLSKPPCSWSTFVANRVSKIADSTRIENWNHVNSEENPADLASRGLSPQELNENKLWWHGPKWLKLSQANWLKPQCNENFETTLEAKAIRVHTASVLPFEDILERFSSFSRAIRVIARIFRFFKRVHPSYKERSNSPVITPNEAKFVQSRLIQISQKAHYTSEYMELKNKQPVGKKSTILSLTPFIDDGGLLRVGGRLNNAPSMSFDERHPIILPYGCHFSKLMVKFIHLVSLHGGNQLVLRLLRMRYWIVKAKNLIRSTIHNCKTCVVYKKREQTQLMAALPASRTQITRPFETTGVDFTGPFDVKNFTGRACLITKGYVCVFVCFSTKAIHLEATSDLSTASFMAALSRFVSRRSCPNHIYSDNGTNFVGASREIKRDFKAFLKSWPEAIANSGNFSEINWHFIPAGAPHMGGLWEAGVKSFKTHFRKIAASMKYTFEELSTLLARIEACLNSRPISPMSDNISDFTPLTPGHFLVGAPLLAKAEPEINDNPISLVNRWQKLKAMNQMFCQRWKSEYLSELQKRHKWKYPQRNLSVNDLVIIREENIPPNEWRLGRIVKIHPGSDEKVRIVDVQTQRGIISRPVVKLVLLPNETH